MIYYKQLSGYSYVIINNGKSYLFDRYANCIKEDAGLSPEYTNGAIKVVSLDILSSCDYIEIGASTDNTFKKYSTSLDFASILVKLQSIRGYIALLKRNGVSDGIRYTQAFFIYNEDFNLNSVLSLINVTEVV